MKIPILFILIVTLVSGLACQKDNPSAEPAPAAAPQLADGIYRVSRYSETRKEILPLAAGEILVIQDQTFGGAEPGEPPVYLVLDDSQQVPLKLTDPPEKGVDEDGKEFVFLQLTEDVSKAFERLTGDNLNQTLAVVIGNKAVSKHKVRAAIAGGRLRVSCCGPGTCDFLFSQLRDNLSASQSTQ